MSSSRIKLNQKHCTGEIISGIVIILVPCVSQPRMERDTISATPSFKIIIGCVMYGLASSLRRNIYFVVYLAETVILIYIIFVLESKWMPWSGRGLGLWGCKDSVRHFITSQIGQPTASRHFRHAFENLHLVFQCFPLR